MGLKGFLYRKFKEKKKKEQRRKELRIKKLLSSGNYKYIENFVKKFCTDFTPKDMGDLSGIADVDYEDFKKLKNLLNKKGIQIDEKELKWLVTKELGIQLYRNFEKKISYNNPKRMEDYIRNFLDIYGEDYPNYINFIVELFRLKKYNLTKDQIIEKIEEIRKKLEIEHFEKKLDSAKLRSISINDLDLMTGHEFEHFLKTFFERIGYKVEHTKLSHDQGADLIVSKFGEKIVVQAKRYSNKVNNKAVQEAVAAIKHRGADRGMVITTSEFTRPAIQLADSNNIELIDRHKLEKLIRKSV